MKTDPTECSFPDDDDRPFSLEDDGRQHQQPPGFQDNKGKLKRVLHLSLAAALTFAVTGGVARILMEMWPSTQFEINGGALMRPYFGFNTLRVKPNTAGQPTPDVNGGAFRISCRTSHMGFFDPIVYPNINNKSHLHTFFGNADLNYNTDFSTGLSSFGRSSCIGGIANRSAYWVPAIIDTTTGFPVVPKSNIVYYKHQSDYRRANPNNVVWPPENLRIIAGNPLNTSNTNNGTYRWECPPGSNPTYEMPGASCANGQEVLLLIFFPQCWDGVNFDSLDHQSHMAYENPDTGCPASHPIVLPQVSFNIHYQVASTPDPLTRANRRPENWRLAGDLYPLNLSAGRSAHGDVVFGWNTTIGNRILNDCLKPTVPVGGGTAKGHDCHVGTLGNSTPSETLY